MIAKSWIIPSKVIGWVNPHVTLLIMGYKRINIDGTKVSSPVSAIPDRRIYGFIIILLRIGNTSKKKINRGRADISEKRSMDEFYENDINDCINEKAIQIRNYLRQN